MFVKARANVNIATRRAIYHGRLLFKLLSHTNATTGDRLEFPRTAAQLF